MKEIEIKSRIRIYDESELTPEDKKLIERAKEAALKSYTPYSRFQVGAAACLSDGTVICGNNQENAAYPSGTCAERTTIFYANATYPEQAVATLAIAAYTNGHYLKAPIPPCGACRQVLLETENRYNRNIRILLYGENGTYEVQTVKDLLPLQFIKETMDE